MTELEQKQSDQKKIDEFIDKYSSIMNLDEVEKKYFYKKFRGCSNSYQRLKKYR
jgi:hypothetical protein